MATIHGKPHRTPRTRTRPPDAEQTPLPVLGFCFGLLSATLESRAHPYCPLARLLPLRFHPPRTKPRTGRSYRSIMMGGVASLTYSLRRSFHACAQMGQFDRFNATSFCLVVSPNYPVSRADQRAFSLWIHASRTCQRKRALVRLMRIDLCPSLAFFGLLSASLGSRAPPFYPRALLSRFTAIRPEQTKDRQAYRRAAHRPQFSRSSHENR